MHLHESLMAEELERFRVYVASLPPPNALDHSTPIMASPSESLPSLWPFPTPRPTHASINGTEPIDVTPSPFHAAPLHSAAASRVASSSSPFGRDSQSTNNNSFLQSTNNNSFLQDNVTTRVPEGMPSYSMPSSLAPTIQDQFRSMHRAFDEQDGNISIASGLSAAHTAIFFQRWIGMSVDPRSILVMAKPSCLFPQNASPIRLTSGWMEVHGNFAGSSAYALQF